MLLSLISRRSQVTSDTIGPKYVNLQELQYLISIMQYLLIII